MPSLRGFVPGPGPVARNARHPQWRRRPGGQFWKLLRIRPTARPSISKGSPGSTTMVG